MILSRGPVVFESFKHCWLRKFKALLAPSAQIMLQIWDTASSLSLISAMTPNAFLQKPGEKRGGGSEIKKSF